jgi:hypothetical protein
MQLPFRQAQVPPPLPELLVVPELLVEALPELLLAEPPELPPLALPEELPLLLLLPPPPPVQSVGPQRAGTTSGVHPGSLVCAWMHEYTWPPYETRSPTP